MKKIAIYTRVSTQEQANEGYSIQAQRDRLVDYCKARDWIIQDIYIDPGFSGSNLDRPAMQRLIANVAEFDLVLVYKLDRLSRSQKDTLYLIEDVFLNNNVDFVSMNESFDTTTPFGRAMIGILSVFAQLEREQIKERSMMGRMERAKEGLYHGGWNTPIGYDYVPESDSLVINTNESEQVKLIYGMYMRGASITEITNHMRNNGYRTKFGNYQHAKTVSNILRSNAYIGKIKFRDQLYQGVHSPIIEEDVFNNVQKILDSKAHLTVKNKPSNSLLLGLIYCDRCKARYGYKSAPNKTPFYGCYSRMRRNPHMIKDENCHNDNWPSVLLESAIEKELFKLASDKNYIYEIIADNDKSSDKVDYNALKKNIKGIDAQIDKLINLYSLGNIPIANVAAKLEELNLAKEIISVELKKSTQQLSAKSSVAEARSILDNIELNWKSFTTDEKRKILFGLIEKIVINGKIVTIGWKFM